MALFARKSWEIRLLSAIILSSRVITKRLRVGKLLAIAFATSPEFLLSKALCLNDVMAFDFPGVPFKNYNFRTV